MFPQSFQSLKYIEPGMSVDGRARHMRSITYLTCALSQHTSRKPARGQGARLSASPPDDEN